MLSRSVWPYSTPKAHTERYRRASFQKLFVQSVDLQEPHINLVDMGMICKMAHHRSVRTMSTKCHPSSLPTMVMLTIIRVNDQQPTQIKMTNENCEYRVRHMSNTWATPSPLPEHPERCCVASVTRGIADVPDQPCRECRFRD